MKLLKQWWSAGGSLLHLTMLLSLAGLRVDLDLCLLPPPPTVLRDELLLLGGAPPSLYAPSPFPAWGGWGHAGQLHPKGREPDPAASLEGQLLREVRALGVPFIPHTRVDAWLVHSVTAGDATGAHGLVSAAASSAGGVSASVDGSSPTAPGGGGDPRAGLSSPLAAEEEERAPAETTAQVPDAGGRASQENEVLREKCEGVDHKSEQDENEERVSGQNEKLLQQNNEDQNKIADKPEVEKTTESRNETQVNGTDISFSLEDLFQLLSSQPEYSMENVSLEDLPPLLGSINNGTNSSAHYSVNFTQAVSHDVNLHEAMLLHPNTTLRRDPVVRTSHSNPEQIFPTTNITGIEELLYDLNVNIFDEINLMATEDFDPMVISQLFQEPDLDSDRSLNSSHHSTSITKSNSSHRACDGGAIGYSSDADSLSHDLEGAVGGYYPEPSKLQRNESGLHGGFTFQHIFHNHTYHIQPDEPELTIESFSWPGKLERTSRYLDDTDQILSRDERRAKALHIPFSVDEIVRMPVDSFNSMLSRHYLSDLQISLIRDIRRRGKNKVAAQNCRKRKLDIILNLEADVCNLQAKKETLEREQAQCNKAINLMKQKLHILCHDIFSRLRDDQGRPVNPNQYTLQCSHDGTVLIMPKDLVASGGHKNEGQKGKRKSERN